MMGMGHAMAQIVPVLPEIPVFDKSGPTAKVSFDLKISKAEDIGVVEDVLARTDGLNDYKISKKGKVLHVDCDFIKRADYVFLDRLFYRMKVQEFIYDGNTHPMDMFIAYGKRSTIKDEVMSK